MASLPDDIDRINALTSNARNTWFALLGVLVFVGLTLMRVEHVDFYGVDRATTLPLVNFDVPTRYFFYAAPILTTAIFGYVHLYLIRLWDALSVAEPKQGNTDATARPLGDLITPWLVTDAALHVRARLRQDGCTTPRTLEGAAMALNILLAWGFGWLVLGLVWWLSMPARDIAMTGIAGLCLVVSLFVGGASLGMMVLRMRTGHDGSQARIFAALPVMGLVLASLPLVAAFSFQRTMGSADRLAPLVMTGEAIVARPDGWLPYPVAKTEYRDAWCKRKSADCAKLTQDDTKTFETDWTARRAATLADMQRPDWSKPSSKRDLNLTQGQLSGSFLVGADLSGAQMDGAVLSGTQMEGVDLRWAQMEGAVLSGAQMQGADLTWAQMEGVELRWAKLEGADLARSRIFGLTDRTNFLFLTNLNASTKDGGALRFVDLTDTNWDDQTDWRGSFMDASVQRSAAFEARMGTPCQWVPETLSDQEFFSVWHWWLVTLDVVPWNIPDDVEAAPLPTPERLAELGLTDCTPGQPFGPMPQD